jgi:hypothetical protein
LLNDLALSRIIICERVKPQNLVDSCIEELLLYITRIALGISMAADSTRCVQEIKSWDYFVETSVISIKPTNLLLTVAIIETGIKDA